MAVFGWFASVIRGVGPDYPVREFPWEKWDAGVEADCQYLQPEYFPVHLVKLTL
jgi:hypothetical protein